MWVDTSQAKVLVVEKGSADEEPIKCGVQCFDAEGNQLTGMAPEYATGPVERGLFYTTSFGGMYLETTARPERAYFLLHESVETVRLLFLGTSTPSVLKHFTIFAGGHDGGSRLPRVWSDQDPSVRSVHSGAYVPESGLYHEGERLAFLNPSAHGPRGLVCTASGGAVGGAWTSGVSYSAYDWVSHGGAAYVALIDHSAVSQSEPGVGASWRTTWQKAAGSVATFTEAGGLAAAVGDLAAAADLAAVIATVNEMLASERQAGLRS